MIVLEGKQYFTIEETAGLLRRHRNTIYNWTLEGKIGFHQPWPGAKILIPESEVFRIKENHAQNHPQKL